MTIPADALPDIATYRFLAHIDADDQIQESIEADSSNVVASENAYRCVWRFGNIEDPERTKRNRVNLIVYDPNDTKVTFILGGTGWGEIEGGAQFSRIILHGASERSSLIIKTTGRGSSTIIGDIEASGGSLRAIIAKTAILQGDISIEGSLTLLLLGEVLGSEITIGSSVPSRSTTIILGEVTDATIDTTSPIRSLIATNWLKNDEAYHYIRAPWMGKLLIRGNKRLGVAGDFQADWLEFEGSPSQDRTLGSAIIAGDVNGSEWTINTNTLLDPNYTKLTVGKIVVGGTMIDCTLEMTGNVGTITVGALDNTRLRLGYVWDWLEWGGFDYERYRLKALIIKGVEDSYFDNNSEVAVARLGLLKFMQLPAQASGKVVYHDEVGKQINWPAGIDLQYAPLGWEPD